MNMREQVVPATSESSEFQRKLFYGLLNDSYMFQDNSTDFLRFQFDKTSQLKRRLKDKLLRFAGRRGFVRRHFETDEAYRRLQHTLQNLDATERFYNSLQDDYSKQLLIELLKFRVLGAQHVRLPSNTQDYWKDYNSIDKRFMKKRNVVTTTSWVWHLNLYEFEGGNGSISYTGHPLDILNTFLLEQYAYREGETKIQVEPGDVVLDCGSCWGDTAIYFADKAGAGGSVYCFEFVSNNLDVIKQNIKLNPHLASSIKITPKALWDKSGEIISYSPNGPGTRVGGSDEQQSASEVTTVSIDDFVKEEGLERVNFIKMDIEGSELKALMGAEKTIQKYRPKLAISVYHKEDDFITIPNYLKELNVGYEFFLDHFTIHAEETILFARPQNG